MKNKIIKNLIVFSIGFLTCIYFLWTCKKQNTVENYTEKIIHDTVKVETGIYTPKEQILAKENKLKKRKIDFPSLNKIDTFYYENYKDYDFGKDLKNQDSLTSLTFYKDTVKIDSFGLCIISDSVFGKIKNRNVVFSLFKKNIIVEEKNEKKKLSFYFGLEASLPNFYKGVNFMLETKKETFYIFSLGKQNNLNQYGISVLKKIF